MKKILCAIIAFCLSASIAFAQLSIEVRLDENNPQEEFLIKDIENQEHGRILFKINGEPDNKGRTPVQIELANNSSTYEFLLADHAWNKKQLKKNWRIYIAKGFSGESTVAVENIYLNNYQTCLVPNYSKNSRYSFTDILVEEGKDYECKIPIHLIEPKPNPFNKKKKMLKEIVYCYVRVSVDNKDETYEKLQMSCDSLLTAFDSALARKEFCTNPKHKPSFEKQIEKYTKTSGELRDLARRPLYDSSCPKGSKKYERYRALLEELDRMDAALEQYKSDKHDCGGHSDPVKPDCVYCELSLEQIYEIFNRHYMDLHNGTVQKEDILNEVNAIYKCYTNHHGTKQAPRSKNRNKYKDVIKEYYDKIQKY